MTIADVVKVLNGRLMAGDGASPRVVGAVVANDLMSDVLLFDADDALLLTSLASDQAIRCLRKGSLCIKERHRKRYVERNDDGQLFNQLWRGRKAEGCS